MSGVEPDPPVEYISVEEYADRLREMYPDATITVVHDSIIVEDFPSIGEFVERFLGG